MSDEVDPRSLHVDPHMEDDDGLLWTLVELDVFDPVWLHPGARVRTTYGTWNEVLLVVKTELLETTDGRTVVLVSFQPPWEVE